MGILRSADFVPFFFQGKQLATSCLRSCTFNPSEKRSTLKGKNLLPGGVNSFFLGKTPFQKGAKAILESVSNSLTTVSNFCIMS